MDQVPELLLGVELDELEPELPPMFGQFAGSWRPGAGVPGAGVDDDEPSLEELLSVDELVSLWAHAPAALPSISPVNPAATIACFSRRVMSFTSLPRSLPRRA